ncbi:hypothetical protein DVH24_042482 [Malus domestica]|uniref:Uncharacterized protein n=1 Tax=Malus domestica TaxID=3750 RepID=A0A498HHC7_MALDO|nr:hypothetical protein DVH24_031505 [Malus domestica]RXH69724.1 hypothetical protein DVH24_042482 [Malus domestica]
MAYQRDKDCLPSTSDALPVLFCFVWSWLSHEGTGRALEMEGRQSLSISEPDTQSAPEPIKQRQVRLLSSR